MHAYSYVRGKSVLRALVESPNVADGYCLNYARRILGRCVVIVRDRLVIEQLYMHL